jgi:DNA-nicking Smr family endonuclease
MAKKDRQHTPPRPPQFSTTPFSALKGVVLPDKSATESANATPGKEPPPPPEENAADLFFQAMAGTRRLNEPAQPKGIHPSAGSRPSDSRKREEAVNSPEELAAAEIFKQEIGRLKLEVKFTEQLPDEDELKAMSGNRLKQLKRGIVTVNHQLDLHGLTREEALLELPRFLRSARLRNQAAVLVITGKGNNSAAEPVLQQAVAAWLRDAGREMVAEYAPAPREMGGSGAFIVFLRPEQKSKPQPS